MKTVRLTDDQLVLVKELLTKIHDDQTNFWHTRGKSGYPNNKLEMLGRALKALEEAEETKSEFIGATGALVKDSGLRTEPLLK